MSTLADDFHLLKPSECWIKNNADSIAVFGVTNSIISWTVFRLELLLSISSVIADFLAKDGVNIYLYQDSRLYYILKTEAKSENGCQSTLTTVNEICMANRLINGCSHVVMLLMFQFSHELRSPKQRTFISMYWIVNNWQ